MKLFEVLRIDLSPTGAVAASLMMLLTLLAVPLAGYRYRKQATA